MMEFWSTANPRNPQNDQLISCAEVGPPGMGTANAPEWDTLQIPPRTSWKTNQAPNTAIKTNQRATKKKIWLEKFERGCVSVKNLWALNKPLSKHWQARGKRQQTTREGCVQKNSSPSAKPCMPTRWRHCPGQSPYSLASSCKVPSSLIPLFTFSVDYVNFFRTFKFFLKNASMAIHLHLCTHKPYINTEDYH